MTSIPIVLITNSNNCNNPFANYLAEILEVEGYFCYRPLDLASESLTQEILKDCKVILLANIAMDDAERDQIVRFVERGGYLIASRPPKELDFLFGLKKQEGTYSTAADIYIVTNSTEPLMANFPVSTLQFHGDADVYNVESSKVLAFLSAKHDAQTQFPAVATHYYGKGKTAIFTYDLAKSIVTAHQGRQRGIIQGENPDRDRDGMFKPNDLFVGLLDPRLKYVPQADLHQDILVRILWHFTRNTCPLPRVWYFPNKKPAIAFLNGDSDGMNEDDLDRVIETSNRYDVKFTTYLMYQHFDTCSPQKVKELREGGHDFGIHPWCGPMPEVTEMEATLRRMCHDFKDRYGYRTASLRCHSTIWPGWIEMAKILRDNGIRIDTNFICGRYLQEGYLNGSGLPVRFIDETGEVIDLYEQATVQTDDGSFTSKCLLPIMTQDEAVEASFRVIDDCAHKFHAVYHPYFHPLNTRENLFTMKRFLRVIERLAERDMPTVNGEEWARFNDARRQIQISQIDVTNNASRFRWRISSVLPINDLTLLFPDSPEEQRLKGVTQDGRPLATERVNWEGLSWNIATISLKEGQEIIIETIYE